MTREQLQRHILAAADASRAVHLTGACESMLEMIIDADNPRVPAAEMARIIAAVVDVASDETLDLLAQAATKERAIVEELVRDQSQSARCGISRGQEGN